MSIKKHQVALSLMILISLLIWSQMILYVLHEFRGYSPIWGLLEYCLSALAERTILHQVIFVGLNIIILYSFFVVIIMVYQQIRLERQWNKVVQTQCDITLTNRLNKRYDFIDGRIVVIHRDSLLALTSGFFRPKIVLSSKLVQEFTEHEILAVLLHEYNHAQKFDPLRLLIIHLIKNSLPFVPILKKLAHYIMVWTEIEADQFAVSQMKSPYELACVLYKCSRSKQKRPIGVGFADDAINYRIQKLVQPKAKIKIPVLEIIPVVMSSILFVLLSIIIISGCS
ncbi:M56 family metallopeptidase [Paenibacillus sp. URB8-2]|uniref:M56 family metallopeptidase n=1 Tax=Paenibacillus sp. URB8-2 TaxID=2741301 RepID=UPI0015BAD001|nr:M56 family metallopeptidase [Paenibacillus sp. URB8-2]